MADCINSSFSIQTQSTPPTSPVLVRSSPISDDSFASADDWPISSLVASFEASEPFDLGQFRKRLVELTSGESTPQSLAFTNTSMPSVNPAVGIELTQKSPSGRKLNQAAPNQCTRGTWHLDAKKIQIQNSSYEKWLIEGIAHSKKALGLENEPGIRIELDNLAIYGEGASWEPLKDTSQDRGVFGNFLVSLPSAHEGGEVRIASEQHPGGFLALSICEYDVSYAACFTNVRFENQPVISGYRVYLVYKMVVDGSSARLSAMSDDNLLLTRLIATYTRAIVDDKALPTEIVLPLSRKSRREVLSLDHLHANDRRAIMKLRQSTVKSCSVFLSYLDRERRSPVLSVSEHSLEGDDAALSLRQVRNVKGELAFDQVAVSSDCVAWRKECPSSGRWSRSTVVVIVPNRTLCAFGLGSGLNHEHRIPEKILPLIDKIRRQPTQDPRHVTQLTNICQLIITKHWKALRDGSNGLRCDALAAVIRGCLVSQSPQLFVDSVGILGSCHGKELSAWKDHFRWIGANFGFEEDVRSKCLKAIKDAVLGFTSTFERAEVLKAFEETFSKTHHAQRECIRDWIDSCADAILDSLPSVAKVHELRFGDGKAMVEIMCNLPSPELQDRVLNRARDLTENTLFIIGFLTGFFKMIAESPPERLAHLNMALPDIYNSALDDFDLTLYVQSSANLQERQHAQESADDRRSTLHSHQPDGGVSHKVADFYKGCLLSEQIVEDAVLLAVADNAKQQFSVQQLKYFVVPFIKSSICVLENQGLTLENQSQYPQMCELLIRNYLEKTVGLKPRDQGGWARQNVDCECDDCVNVNYFMNDNERRKWKFPLVKVRRKHVEAKLSAMGAGHTFSVDRVPRPNVLEVTKGENEHANRVKLWEQSVRKAEAYLKQLGSQVLRKILPHQYFVCGTLAVSQLPFLDVERVAQDAVRDRKAHKRKRRETLSGIGSVSKKVIVKIDLTKEDVQKHNRHVDRET